MKKEYSIEFSAKDWTSVLMCLRLLRHAVKEDEPTPSLADLELEPEELLNEIAEQLREEMLREYETE